MPKKKKKPSIESNHSSTFHIHKLECAKNRLITLTKNVLSRGKNYVGWL